MIIDGWDKLREKLRASCDASGEGYTVHQVRDKIEQNQAQWHYFNKCAIITQVIEKPCGDVCNFWLVAGDLEDLKQCEGHVIKWARSIGCVEVRHSGRRGWQRALSGDWEEFATVCRIVL